MTTQPCVSPGTGTISPDLRVFYQYGMVLGLNDFLQEQTHNLGLDYHHERSLHGYGTVYGLRVTASTPLDAPDDVTLTVEPGIYIPEGSTADPKWWNIGVRIEDTVLVTAGGMDCLSCAAPREAVVPAASAREIEVLEALAEHATNAEIAARLFISPRTGVCRAS